MNESEEIDGRAADALAETLAGLRERQLRDFAAATTLTEPGNQVTEVRFATQTVAASDSIRLVLDTVVDATACSVGDKVRWERVFEYRSVPCRLRHGKSGLKLIVSTSEVDQDAAADLGREVEARLHSAVRSLYTRVIAGRVEKQLANNRAELVNQHVRYRATVDYFLGLLSAARARGPVVDPAEIDADHPGRDVLEVLQPLFASTNHSAELAHLSTAGLAAYFAYLQHTLVLLSAFSPTALQPDFSLQWLLKARWAEQFDTAFPPPHPTAITRSKTQLARVASDYRNLILHGGGGRAADGMWVEWIKGHFALVSEDGNPTDQWMLWQPALSTADIDLILNGIASMDETLRSNPFFEWVDSGVPVDFRRDAVQAAVDASATGTVADFVGRACEHHDHAMNGM